MSGIERYRKLLIAEARATALALQSIASILAAGYLRYRRRIRREERLDNPATSSPHGHEVNGTEKGE